MGKETRDERLRRKLPPQAYSPNGKPYVMARIALPENHIRRKNGLAPFYYSPDNQNVPWVEVGYKTWTIDEWASTYSEDYQDDVRHWDFFGEEIDIWEGYSDE